MLAAVSLTLALGGAALLVFFSLPFEQAQILANRLASDGVLESFTPVLYAGFAWLRWLGASILLAAGALWLLRRAALALLARLAAWLDKDRQALAADLRSFTRALKPTRQEWPAWGMVLVFTLLSLLNKAALLTQPMGHDEAYTVVAFAARPLFYVLSDYHLPNNHVFHTILVHLVYHLFGSSPWLVRLPAMLAGVLLVPAGYLAGKALFNRPAGVLAAGILAVLPILRDYSTHARGYSLLVLWTLLAIGLAAYLVQRPNRFAWLLLALVTALGFYTIPIMLYPAGVVFTWLGLAGLGAALLRRTNPINPTPWFAQLVASGLLALALTGILYLPILVYSGASSITANSFVQPLPWGEVFPNALARLYAAWQEWNRFIPAAAGALAGLAFVTGLVLPGKVSMTVPLPVAFAAWMALALSIQRVAPEARVWLFALPVFVLYACGGAALLAGRVPSWQRAAWWGMAVFITLLLAWGLRQSQVDFQRVLSGNQGANELAARFLDPLLQPGDVVIVDYEDAPALWYYMEELGRSHKEVFSQSPRSFETAYLVVNTRAGQTLEGVIAATGWQNVLNPLAAQPVEVIGPLEITRFNGED